MKSNNEEYFAFVINFILNFLKFRTKREKKMFLKNMSYVVFI